MKTAFLNVEWVNFYLFSSELVHSTLLQFFLGYSPCITLVKKYVTFRGRPLQMDFFQLRSFDDPSHQYNQLNKIWHWLGIGMYSQTKLKIAGHRGPVVLVVNLRSEGRGIESCAANFSFEVDDLDVRRKKEDGNENRRARERPLTRKRTQNRTRS